LTIRKLNLFLTLIIYLAATLSVQAQEFNAKNLKVEWSDSSKLLITYDLSNPEDKEVNIKIFLMSDEDPGLKIEVKSAKGKIGSGKFSGSGNKVVWEIYSDYPDVKKGESYYFTLQASVVEEESTGWPWYYYLGGGVVAGITGWLIANSSQSASGSDGGNSSGSFPTPPDRN